MYNIYHLMPYWDTGSAGLAEVVRELAKAESNLGIHVSIGALEPRKKFSSLGDYDQYNLELFKPRMSDKFGFPSNIGASHKILEADLIHVHGLWMGNTLAAFLLKKRHNKPYVVHVHGMASDNSLSYSPIKKKIVGKVFHNSFLSESDAVIATNTVEQEAILKNLNLKSDVVNLGHNDNISQRICSIPRKKTKTVLYVGRLHPKKGLQLLLNAWQKSEIYKLGWDLKIIGPGEPSYVAELAKQVSLKTDQSITLDGPIYGDDKYKQLAEASVYVLPSENESFGLTIAEALSVGTPVLCSQGTPWSIVEKVGCGFWFEQSENKLQSILREVSSLSEHKLKEMGSKGRKLILEEYSWRASATQAISLYERILKNGN